jgi:hypothetical protein
VAEPHWMSYVGMVTGIIGAFSGVAGSVMGYVSYHRSNKLKSLDLRLELRKAVSGVRVELQQLRELMHSAEKSRINNLAARGMSSSSGMDIWKEQVKSDKAKIGSLSQSLPNEETDYNKLEPKELESELVIIHGCQKEIDVLRDKYLLAMRSDEDFSKSRKRSA